MKRFLRRGAVLLAATATCATLLPVATAQAVGTWSPCDNEVVDTPTPTAITLPQGLGTVYIVVDTNQDSYVQYDSPGAPALDTLVGVDVQEINLDDDLTVCVTVSGFGVMVSVNVVNLEVDVCQFTGQNPYTPLDCLVGSWT